MKPVRVMEAKHSTFRLKFESRLSKQINIRSVYLRCVPDLCTYSPVSISLHDDCAHEDRRPQAHGFRPQGRGLPHVIQMLLLIPLQLAQFWNQA